MAISVLSLCVGVWQGMLVLSGGSADQPEAARAGFAIGGGFMLLARAALLILYAVAVGKAGKLFQAHRQKAAFGAAATPESF